MTANAPMTVGLIGLDTSHVPRFARLLNDPEDPHHVPGARVVAGYPGGSPDFELSYSRVPQYTRELQGDYDVEILDSPEQVAKHCDLVMITAVDGRAHRDLVQRVLPAGKPIFVDKPMATTLEDAKAMIDMCQTQNVPLMSCSSLRYADNFRAAVAQTKDLQGIDLFGPMAMEDTQPGFFWYGVHSVEILISAMGPDVLEVNTMTTEDHDVAVVRYKDGRVGTIHGLRESHLEFGAVLHAPDGPKAINLMQNERPYYASMLQAIIESLSQGQSGVPTSQMLATVATIEAINRSRDTGESVVID